MAKHIPDSWYEQQPNYKPVGPEKVASLMENFRGRFTTAKIAINGIPSTIEISGILEPARGPDTEWYVAKVSSDIDGQEDEYLSVRLHLDRYEDFACDEKEWTLRATTAAGSLTLDVQPPDPD